MIWDAEERYLVPSAFAAKSDVDPDVVILALTDSDTPAIVDAAVSPTDDTSTQLGVYETCLAESMLALSLFELPSSRINLIPLLTMARAGHEMSDTMGAMLANMGTRGVDLISYARHKMAPDFATAYRDLLKRVAIAGLQRIQDEATRARATITGTASTYNPFRDGREEGGPQTASGEPYDPAGWTAAIKTDLRKQFRGVRYGKLYQPAFALVESGNKQLIVKINDVGPLRPGRVLDLNERSMRHFDPFMTRGLIQGVKITLLPGEDWTPGPVGNAYAFDLPVSEWRTASAQSQSIESPNPLADAEIVRLPAPVVHIPYPRVGEGVRAELTPSSGG
jgi:rare lipoprotein A